MIIWLIKAREDLPDSTLLNPFYPWYDKSHGFVIRAKNELDARKLAASQYAEEGGEAWLDPGFSYCEKVTAKGEAEVLLVDFRAA